ncbi:MAG TPA: acyl-CoA dehydrogenase family protein [Candidatus Acidoferrales bacterium]|nr:acyl-CoA dehydrogenase family protein [Candidatus Acidoferrales bacterium]
MEERFSESVRLASQLDELNDDQLAILERVDEACGELFLPEFEHYVARKFNPETREVLRKYGLMGLTVSKDYGGMNADPLTWALALERFGQLGMGVVTFVDVHCLLASLAVQHWGSEVQKKTYLMSAARGEKVLAYGLTEPEAGSDPASLKTSYEERDSGYVLNGTKYLISNGSVADSLVIFAYPKGKSEGLSAFIVDSKSEGFSVAMRLEEKIGLFTSDTAMLEMVDCKIPKENLLGQAGKGLHVAYSALLNGRIGIASGCVGIIQDCINSATERVKSRIQHKKPIGKHQLIQRHISNLAMNLEMARWPTYFAAVEKMRLDANSTDLELRHKVDLQSAIAKRVASRLAYDSADSAVQVFGGFGYSLLSPVARHLCDSRVARIYEGTDEIMDLKIASLVLGKGFEAYS